jgi:uncharacterized protein YcnI
VINRRRLATAIAVCWLALPATAAWAHVEIAPDAAPAGQDVRFDVRVPNERDNSATTKLDLKMPPGFVFVSYQPVAGWHVKVTTQKLARPVVSEGERATERVSQITWTGSGSKGRIGPGQFQDFGLSAKIPGRPGQRLTFKALQIYDDGQVVRWIGPPDSDEPAPQVEVTSPSGEGGGEAQGGGNEDDSDTATVVALVVGGLALLLGGGALLRARGRPQSR